MALTPSTDRYVIDEVTKLQEELLKAEARDDRTRRRMIWAQLKIEQQQRDPTVIRLRYKAEGETAISVRFDGVFFLTAEGGVATAVIGRETPDGMARPKYAPGSYGERNGRIWDQREELFPK